MLTRINGVAFATKEELDEHMHMLGGGQEARPPQDTVREMDPLYDARRGPPASRLPA